jgi:S1-C subfamily serine protease
MNEDSTAGQGMGGEQTGPDSPWWAQERPTTPLDWSGQAGGQTPQPTPQPDAQDSPWARPTGPVPPAGAGAPQGTTPPPAAAPPYAPPYAGVPPYAQQAGAVPPTTVPLSWPGSPYAAEPAAASHGLSRTRLTLAGIALVVLSATSSALIVNALKSNDSSPNTATSNFNGGGTQNAGNNNGNSSNGSNGSLGSSAIADAVDKGVVDITTNLGYQNAAAAGTGMVLTSNGEILTNNHVVRGATTIKVTVVTTGKTYTAKVVGTDPTDDVAVVQAQDASGLSTIPLGNSSSVKVGDAVVAIGNAGGTGGTPSVVTGSVTNLNQTITASDDNGTNSEQLHGLIQVNAPIVAGDSGGPLANSSGKVIGMDTAASSTQARFSDSGQGSEGYAIPINDALAIAKKIESGQASSKIHIGLPGFLGVEVADNSSSSNSNGFGGFGNSGGNGNSTSGAVVQGTTDNSPAANAGITAGDVITSVNGTPVDSAQTLTSLLSGHHKGDQVTVGWTDSSGQTHSATITLTEGPAD